MRYALILMADLNDDDWICHAISPTKKALQDLNCYNASVMKLPKTSHPGTVEPGSFTKTNCETGMSSTFTIVKLHDTKLTGKFNMS